MPKADMHASAVRASTPPVFKPPVPTLSTHTRRILHTIHDALTEATTGEITTAEAIGAAGTTIATPIRLPMPRRRWTGKNSFISPIARHIELCRDERNKWRAAIRAGGSNETIARCHIASDICGIKLRLAVKEMKETVQVIQAAEIRSNDAEFEKYGAIKGEDPNDEITVYLRSENALGLTRTQIAQNIQVENFLWDEDDLAAAWANGPTPFIMDKLNNV